MKIEIIDKLVCTHRTIDVYINGLLVVQSTGDSCGNFWMKTIKDIVKVTSASNTDRRISIQVENKSRDIEAPVLDLEHDSSEIIFQKIEDFVKSVYAWKNEVCTLPKKHVFEIGSEG